MFPSVGCPVRWFSFRRPDRNEVLAESVSSPSANACMVAEVVVVICTEKPPLTLVMRPAFSAPTAVTRLSMRSALATALSVLAAIQLPAATANTVRPAATTSHDQPRPASSRTSSAVTANVGAAVRRQASTRPAR